MENHLGKRGYDEWDVDHIRFLFDERDFQIWNHKYDGRDC